MTPEVLDLMEERRKAKADIQNYRELDKQVKKRCNEAKEHWINTQSEKIEANTGVNNKTVHSKTKDVIRRKATAKTDGDILMEEEVILNRWSECIIELYHDDRRPPPIINNDEGPQILEDGSKGPQKEEKSSEM